MISGRETWEHEIPGRRERDDIGDRDVRQGKIWGKKP